MSRNNPDELALFWDAFALGNDLVATDLDPTLANVVQSLHFANDVDGVDLDFVARLKATLLVEQPESRSGFSSRLASSTMNGHASALSRQSESPTKSVSTLVVSARQRGTQHGRHLLSYVSLAILLMLTLGGVWSTIAQHHGDTTIPFEDPTIQVSGHVALNGVAVLERFTLEPGAIYLDKRQRPTLLLVEEGSVSFYTLLDGARRNLPAGETERVTTVQLFGLENVSSNRVILLIAGFYSADVANHSPEAASRKQVKPPGVSIERVDSWTFGSDLSGGGTLSLRRMPINADDVLVQWQTTGKTFILVDKDGLSLTLSGNDLPFPFVSGVELRLIEGDSIALLPDVTVEARNTSDVLLMLNIFTIEPEPIDST